MTKQDFLQIFKSGFHKLVLKKVININKTKNKNGRKYINCLGLFEFIPPEQVWIDEEQIDYEFLNNLLEQFKKELSNCIVRKFTKIHYNNDVPVKKQTKRYIFDVIPKNIVKFKFYKEQKIMRLVVKGYCWKK